MIQNFESSVAFVLSAEGGFVTEPVDKGGPTSLGVTQGTFSSWLLNHGLPDAPVSTISREYAEAIYLELYWNAGGCDKLPSPLNLVHFDSTVQHGRGGAGPLLRSATAFPGASVEQEAFALLVLRDNLYRRIALRDPSQQRFLVGWLNRLANLRKAAGL